MNRATKNLSKRAKYTLFGIAFGATFPLFSTVAYILLTGRTVLEAHQEMLMWIINSAPFILGLVFSLVGDRQDKLINAHEKLKEALENKNKVFLQALEESSGITMTDRNGIITYVNENYCTFSKYKREELVGKPHSIVASGVHSKVFFKNIWETISFKEVWRGEFQNRAKDGTPFFVSATILPILDEDQKVTGYIAVTHNLTKKKRHEKELQLALERAESAAKTKAQFLANMSHEIRAPMNAIIGTISLLVNSVEKSEVKNQLMVIRRSSEGLLTLLNNILDFSKIDAGRLEIEIGPVDLHEEMELIKNFWSQQISEKGLNFIVNISGRTPRSILADATRLHQIIMNLTSNALKFTEKGHITISIDASDTVTKKKQILFEIEDTGSGVPEELRHKLFQSFSQVDGSTTRTFGGTGLGLAISKGLCLAMSGDIWYEPNPLGGSKFCFTIIVEESSAPTRSLRTEEPSKEIGPSQPLKILLAEDNPVNQMVAVKMLERLGHQVTIANNGLEVLSALEVAWPDCILMDCQMPQMDGYEASMEIRKRYPDEQLPIVAITANALKGDREKCIEAGMNDFLPKPISLEKLTHLLKSYPPIQRSDKNLAS